MASFEYELYKLMRKPVGTAKPPPLTAAAVGELVVGLGVALIAWALLALLPHDAPYDPGLLLSLTLAAWSTSALVLVAVLAAVLVALLVASEAHVRPLDVGYWVLALVALPLAATGFVWPLTLDLNGQQDAANGRLRLAWRHCDGVPWQACLHAPGLQIDARTPAERTMEAVRFFSESLYGAPLNVAAMRASATAIDVTYGDTGRAECTVRVDEPVGDGGVLLSLGGKGAATLAARHGLALVAAPGTPAATCGAAGRIATVAAAANAVADALFASGRTSVALYGCSIAGKMASYASATFDRDYGHAYDRVFVDSGGSMGLASARHVGRGGETFHALLDRWPGWLAANASASRHARDWPDGVDVVDLILESCLAGTAYHTTTSVDDLWNAPSALQRTVDAAALVGCVVHHTESQGSKHCELF